MNRNPMDWWEPEFWSRNTPGDHFETPSTLCGSLLTGKFLTWMKRIDLAGVLELGCGEGKILTEIARNDLRTPALGIDLRPISDYQGWDYAQLRWDTATESWHSIDSADGPNAPMAHSEFEAVLDCDRPLLAYAVEWLDDLPATVATTDAAGRLVVVGPDGSTAPLSDPDHAWLRRWWPRVGRSPGGGAGLAVVGRTRDNAWRWLARHLPQGSLLVTLDYGHTSADRPADGGLAAHRDGVRVAPGPGAGVTAAVAIDSLAAAVEETGARRLWCHRLTDLPPDFWPTGGAPLASLALRSQEQLLRDPRRFGGFWLVAHRIGGERS